MNGKSFYIIVYVLGFVFLFTNPVLKAQEHEEIPGSVLEANAETREEGSDDDNYQQDLEFLSIQPVSIHRVDEEMLRATFRLTPLQINAFIQYRTLFGPFRNKYELQAVPYWDIATIKRVLPFLRFDESAFGNRNLHQQFTKGQHQLLARIGSVLEKSKGFKVDSLGSRLFTGGPIRYFFRYNYQYKQQLWWGITGDKDAGENFGSARGFGMDFTSFHFFIRPKGLVESIAIGDYTLNIGQGLIQWQGLTFGKTGEAIGVYRQGKLLQPYRSGGEWNFHRGIAIQFQRKKLELTSFGSSKKITGNIAEDENGNKFFTSLSKSGFHRSGSEISDKNSVNEIAFGSVLQYTNGRFRSGISAVKYEFSIPWYPGNDLYKIYAIRGSSWFNSGIYYSYSVANYFLFGELAYSKTGLAALQGAVVSLHSKVDLSIVYRNLQPGFQSLYSGTFSENSAVNNEEGLYAGLKVKPWPGWQLQGYADFFRFPWLRFRANAPGAGHEFYIQVQFAKRKKWELASQFRSTDKPENQAGEIVDYPLPKTSRKYRIQFEKNISSQLIFAARSDLVWLRKADVVKKGMAFYFDERYHINKPALSISARLQYFNTDDYDTRIYAYERDLLYSFSIPAVYDKGIRYYLQMQGKLPGLKLQKSLKIQWWIRWAQTLYPGKHSIGSGPDEIIGNLKSDWKCQLLIGW